MDKIAWTVLVLVTYILLNCEASISTAIKSARSTGLDRQRKEKLFIDLPEEETKEDVGEICDPNKPNSCEISTHFCTWMPEDLQYRCSDHKDKRLVHVRAGKAFKKMKNQKKLNEDIEEHKHELIKDDDPVHSKRKLEEDNSREIRGRSFSELHTGPHPPHVRPRQQNPPITTGNLTKEVPPYSGNEVWNGRSSGPFCTLKHVMAEKLQEARKMSDKVDWAENNKDSICDFTKFFHCTKEPPEPDDPAGQAEYNNPESRVGVCRCYEASMPVVDSICYLPVGLGLRSTCGNDITAPYPVEPWPGASVLKPNCTPNSECIESQFWFGTRCSCELTAEFNKRTSTCDYGSRITPTLAMVLVHLWTFICLN